MTLTVCSSLKNGRYAKKMAPACASSSLLCSDVQKVVPCWSSSWRKRSLKSTRSRWHGRRGSPCRCSLTKKTAPMFPLRDFLTQICLRATMSSSPSTGPAILPPLTRKPPAQTRKISMEGVDNQALTEKAVQGLRVSEFGQHYFTRTSWNLIFWVLWSLSFQNIWYFLFTKVNGCRVICTYSRGSQKRPFFYQIIAAP